MSARASSDPLTSAYAAAKQPLAGGFLDADAVAAAALFLLSDEAGQITGPVPRRRWRLERHRSRRAERRARIARTPQLLAALLVGAVAGACRA